MIQLIQLPEWIHKSFEVFGIIAFICFIFFILLVITSPTLYEPTSNTDEDDHYEDSNRYYEDLHTIED